MAFWRAISAVAIFGVLADAIPTISYPINSQIPPIARVSTPYLYTFPQSTFASALALSYSLSNAPDWLSLDSTSRTLSGTPSNSDVGAGTVTEVSFELVATDTSGSVSLDTTLAVSKGPAPTVDIPVDAQLPSYGFFSAPSTSLYHPSSPFDIKFDPETFLSPSGENLTYYALTADDTPLPSWVLFDEGTLTFSGQTPEYASLIQPPQTFGIQLIASDIPGYSGASLSFNIEVGVHLLAFSTTDLFLNATPGTDVEYTGLSGSLQLDGQVANASSIASVTAQTPAWLTFDDSTLTFSGTPPADAVSCNVSVQATDVYGDTAATTIFVEINTSLVFSSIPNVNATIGSMFSLDLSDYVVNASGVDVTAQISPTTSWIDFDAHDLVLSGQVPKSAEPSTITVTLSAKSKSSNNPSTETFSIVIISSKTSSVKGSTSSSASGAAASSTSTSNSKPKPSANTLSHGKIAAIVVPILFLIVALLGICLFYCRKRRKDARTYTSGRTKEDISGPLESKSSLVGPTYSTRQIAPLQLDTSGFTMLNNASSVYTSTEPNPVARNKRKSLRRSQTISNGARSNFPESQSSAMRARAYSENALGKEPHRNTWRNTQESEYPTLNSSSRTNSSQMLSRNFSRKGHARRSTCLNGSEPRVRNSTYMGPLGTQSLLATQPSDKSILNLSDTNFSSSPLDSFSALSGDWSGSAQPSGTTRPSRRGSNADLLRTHRKSTTRNLNFFTGSANNERRSGVGHGGRESISSFDILNTPGNRRSIGRGPDWPGGQDLRRNSRTWRTVATFASDGQKRRSGTSIYSSASTDLMKFGAATIAPTEGKDFNSIRQVPKSPAPTPLIWEQETGQSNRVSFSSNSTRPVSRRVGSSPFFGGGTSSLRRKARSYADSPTVPEEVHIGGNPNAIDIHDESLGITYHHHGYNSAREGTRQLRSYIQSTFSKTRLKPSDSMASIDSRFESVSGSMQDLQTGRIPPSHSRHTQLLEIDRRREAERGESRGEFSDILSSEFSAGSWESIDADSQPNYIRHGESSSPVSMPGSSAADVRGKNTAGFDVEQMPTVEEQESPVMGNLGPNARMVKGARRRPISVDVQDNKRISSTKAKMGRHGESSGNISPGKSDAGSVDYRAYI